MIEPSNFASWDAGPAHSAATILLVEDEVLVRMMHSEELRAVGYTVIEAADANEALSILRSGTGIDVVLTDMNMPGALDGCALIKVIRSEFPFLKVIMVSAHRPEAEVQKLLDGYVAKPVLLSELIGYLQSVTAVDLALEAS